MPWESLPEHMRDEIQLDEAYSRVTNPERFRILHSTMLAILAQLDEDFDVGREEGYGLDEELERRFVLARPSIRLTPSDPEAAPLTVAFSDFPGLHIRFGLWWTEPFPDCGCDACGGSGEEFVEVLTELIGDVTAGLFWESRDPHWTSSGIWGKRSGRSRNLGATGDWSHQRQLNWKHWPRRSHSNP